MACMRLIYINILAEIINSIARSRLCLYHTKCQIESRKISYYWGQGDAFALNSGEFEHIVFQYL